MGSEAIRVGLGVPIYVDRLVDVAGDFVSTAVDAKETLRLLPVRRQLATGLPFLVMTTSSLVSVTSSMSLRHLALNSDAVMVRSTVGVLPSVVMSRSRVGG